jgi:hypothetical protein
VDRKEWVASGEATDKMTLPCVDGFFRSVGAVKMWWCELEVGASAADERFEGGRAFIVKNVEQGLEATVAQIGVELGEGVNQGVLVSGLQWFGEDGIGVMVIKNHDIFITTAGGVGKTAGLVAVSLAGEVHDLDCHTVGSNVILRVRGRCHNACGGGERRIWGRLRFGGADVFGVLAEMTFCRFEGLGEVFAYQGRSEVWPSGEVTCIDGFAPGGDDRATRALVEVRDDVLESVVVGVDIVGKGNRWCCSREQWRWRSEVDVPEGCDRIAFTDGGFDAIFDEVDVRRREDSLIAIVTKLTEREEGTVGEARENVSGARLVRERW